MKLSLCRIRGSKSHETFIIAKTVPKCMEVLDTKEVMLVEETFDYQIMRKMAVNRKRCITYI